MKLSTEDKATLGVALNEATLLGVELDPGRRAVGVTFSVLTLPEAGPEPEDARVQLVLSSVGRIAASLRSGSWDDAQAEVVPFEVADLLAVVQSFEGEPIYGWEFFDLHEQELEAWGERLSLDWGDSRDDLDHSLCLFQEGTDRHLDLCIWFGSLEIRSPSGELVPLEDFCEGGRRWWEALESGDPRTDGHGIAPAGEDG